MKGIGREQKNKIHRYLWLGRKYNRKPAMGLHISRSSVLLCHGISDQRQMEQIVSGSQDLGAEAGLLAP